MTMTGLVWARTFLKSARVVPNSCQHVDIARGLQNEGNFKIRTVVYLGKLFQKQFRSGMAYEELKETTAAGILNFVMFPQDEEFAHEVALMKVKNGEPFSEILSLWIFELPKLENAEIDTKMKFVLELIRNPDSRRLKNMTEFEKSINRTMKATEPAGAKKSPGDARVAPSYYQRTNEARGIQDLYKTLKSGYDRVMANPKLRFKIMQDEMVEMDWNSALGKAERKGVEEGRKEEALNIARELVRRGVAPGIISASTKLPLSQIQSLRI